VGTDDKGEREGVPVLIGVRRFVERRVGTEGPPVAAIVCGDIGAIGTYGDPGFVVAS
jgi:hypothetical protein